ncbi:hypothetical protein NOGI109294_14220 [Nocardiopsis gilva]
MATTPTPPCVVIGTFPGIATPDSPVPRYPLPA